MRHWRWRSITFEGSFRERGGSGDGVTDGGREVD